MLKLLKVYGCEKIPRGLFPGCFEKVIYSDKPTRDCSFLFCPFPQA